jgi:hypothetical protein
METSPPGSFKWIESPFENAYARKETVLTRGPWFTCGFLEMRCIGAVHWNDPFRGLMLHVSTLQSRPGDLSRQCPFSVVPAPTFNGRRHPGVNFLSSRERTVPIVFRCVSVIRRDVRRIRIGLIGRRRNTLCYLAALRLSRRGTVPVYQICNRAR